MVELMAYAEAMALRRYLAEFVGTGLLVAVVVGSGTMATQMSSDRGVELLINTFSTIFALGVLILLFSPISGAHFNPVVTLNDWVQRHISVARMLGYIVAQFAGAFVGVMLANLMFKNPAIFSSHHLRSGSNLWLGEVVATAGLLFMIEMMRGQKQLHLAPIVLAAWIGSAYFFSSSTSFANPAVTFGRTFTDTFSGIAWKSLPAFVAAQLVGAAVGAFAGRYFSQPELPADTQGASNVS